MMERWVAFRLIRLECRGLDLVGAHAGRAADMPVTKEFFFFLFVPPSSSQDQSWSSSLTDITKAAEAPRKKKKKNYVTFLQVEFFSLLEFLIAHPYSEIYAHTTDHK